jgi:putative redox protein|tara:strand:- start:6234 stop:6992 length:759 start_codon:yes stop_codon:yes gene_type:complete
MMVSVTETELGGVPRLDALLVEPDKVNAERRGVVLCHGFPSAQRLGTPNRSYEKFAERIAAEQGWVVLAVSLRGCGASEGQFSMSGWLEDIARAIRHLRDKGISKIWLIGSTTGGSLALMAAARDPEIRGVAVMAPRADFDDWASDPRRFVQHCRSVGVIKDESFPPSLSAWARELKENRAIDAVERIKDMPLLIVHGTNDRQVPYEDARQLAQIHPSPQLRLIKGADHRIRHDPRAVSILMGWLEREAVET